MLGVLIVLRLEDVLNNIPTVQNKVTVSNEETISLVEDTEDTYAYFDCLIQRFRRKLFCCFLLYT